MHCVCVIDFDSFIGDEHLDDKEQLLHKLLADPLIQVLCVIL